MKKNRVNKVSENNGNEQRKRRLIYFGPGLIAALILSLFIGYNWYRSETQKREMNDMPPIVERQVLSSLEQEKLGLTPEVIFLIERRDKLGLSDTQTAELKALQAEWKKLYGPKIAEANKAAAKTGEYLAGARYKSRTPSAHIQSEAAPLILLSREISSARNRYWDEAMQILTPRQRIKAQKEREIQWAARKNSPAR